MDESHPRKQSIFKIVSLTKNKPIFLYKVTEPVLTMSDREEQSNETAGIASIRRAKEEI